MKKVLMVVSIFTALISFVSIANDAEVINVYYDSMWKKRRVFVNSDTFKSEADIKIKINNHEWLGNLLEQIDLSTTAHDYVNTIPELMNIILFIKNHNGKVNRTILADYGYLYKRHNHRWLKYRLNQESKDVLHCTILKACQSFSCRLDPRDLEAIKKEKGHAQKSI